VKNFKLLEKQKKVTSQLQAERSDHLAKIFELNNEVTHLNSQLVHLKKQVKMMTTRTDVLEEILESQIKGKPNGIDFDSKAQSKKLQNKNFVSALKDFGKVRKKKEVQDIKFVYAGGIYNPTMNKSMLQHPKEHHSKNKKISHPRICHYCGRKGHIGPLCFKLYGYPNQVQQKLSEPEVKNVKKKWKPKSDIVGLMTLTSLTTPLREDWYFNSGCSRHMTGVVKFLDTVKSYISSHVAFGDGVEGKILGIGSLVNNGFLKLDNVLLVKGLASNLISISQLCDQGINVYFNKSKCLVTNRK